MRTILSVVEEPGRKEQLAQITKDVLSNSRWLPTGCYQVEIKREFPDGVRFYDGMTLAYDEEQLLHDLEHKGFFSAHPFTVLRPYDSSCDACTVTLSVSFCRVYDLDPVGLFRQAYPLSSGRAFHRSSVSFDGASCTVGRHFHA